MKVLLCKEPGCEARYIVTLKDIDGVVNAFMEDSDIGDKLLFELANMTLDEIRMLHEFNGC
jgi:hypothetical protein